MGVLKTLTDEYFGETIREEDKIPIGDLDVEIVSFTDNNGVEHKHGYKVKDGNPDEMVKTLKVLIKRIIEKRGPECSLNDIDVFNIKQMCYKNEGFVHGVFENSPFNGDISGWNVSNVKDMDYMFFGAKSFNQDISGWDVSNVKNMIGMFQGAKSFNQPLDKWGDKLSKVKSMSFMFSYTQLENNNKLPKWYR